MSKTNFPTKLKLTRSTGQVIIRQITWNKKIKPKYKFIQDLLKSVKNIQKVKR